MGQEDLSDNKRTNRKEALTGDAVSNPLNTRKMNVFQNYTGPRSRWPFTGSQGAVRKAR